MKNEKDKHTERVLRYLRERGPLNPLQAWKKLGVYRLGARIFDLRQAGHRIDKHTQVVRNRFGEVCRVARYVLVEDKPT